MQTPSFSLVSLAGQTIEQQGTKKLEYLLKISIARMRAVGQEIPLLMISRDAFKLRLLRQ